ncbi:MAG: hypothetical protein BWK78_01930 [Thiotrichaceae bacterium IS1]|nr:MAG: hypothetical protein BWK78_01930 [Thiotrichaceae bacterium IS1]
MWKVTPKITVTPKWNEQWQELTRLLKLDEGFQLIFIFIDESQTVDLLREQLKQQFGCYVLATPVAATEQLYHEVMRGLSKLIELAEADRPQAVLVDLHRYHTINESMRVLLARLNERREWLRNGLKKPLIFALSTKTDVGRYAPDFWSIREVTFFLNDSLIYPGKVCPIPCFLRKFTDWSRGILHNYFQQVKSEHHVFNIKGLRTRGEYNIELEDVFVKLYIALSTASNQPHSELLRVEELQGNQLIWKFLSYGRKFYKQLLLVVIGTPGCGKTTLLQYVALQFATKAPHNLPGWIPILLFLRQHVKTILTERPLLADLVQQHFANPKRYPDLQLPSCWFHERLCAGCCLVLLDGLDEVANAEERQQISAWIDEQIINYPCCPFVVTSRPRGYHVAPLARATAVLEVQSFSPSQVRGFIEKWYLATEIKSWGGQNDASVKLQAKREADDLQLRLHTRPELLALTVNPLLLTMIAMVHRYRGQLPGRRVELYSEICDVLLGHWRQAKGIQDSLTAAQKRVALQPLAAWMMKNAVREIDLAKAIEVIRIPLQTLGITDGKTFLQEVQESSSGLFSEREMGVWSFAHLTFQEYLAATHFKEQKIHGNWWDRKVTDSWWHETLRLYAAQADATLMMKSCLQIQSVTTLTLAADCLEEALQLDKSVRHKMETLLTGNLEFENPELFKLAAEVKLQRRLKKFRHLDETREIDLNFISNAEYQLFLDEMQSRGAFYQPDHWGSRHFQKGSAQYPVVGVRTTDAKEFCNWLSNKTNQKYRCPTLAEAQEFLATDSHESVSHRQLAMWCSNDYKSWDLHWESSRAKQEVEANLLTLLKESWVMKYVLQEDIVHTFRLARNLTAVQSSHFFALALALGLPPPNPDPNLNPNPPNAALARAFHAQSIDSYDGDLASDISDLTSEFGYNSTLQDHLKERNFTAARQYVQTLPVATDVEQRRKNLLTKLLIILTATNNREKQQIWRSYTVDLAEYAMIGYEILNKQAKQSTLHAEEKRGLALLHVWTKIVEARQQEEKFPAWEGIWLVRDNSDWEKR